MGAVYEAYDQERHETVALKTLRWQDPSAIYRLKKEFRVLSDIAHANLASLYELVADGDDWFYTMELVDGVEFFDYVRPERPSQSETRAPPDVPRLRAALAQLIKGVVALHRAGIVHRDLKPSNVLVTPAGRVVILDFGLADVVAPPSPLQTREEGLWGTVAYMSPEQVEGQRSPASDWYAVGVMLYEALTGRLPFQGSALRVLADKGRQDPPRLSELVPELPQDLVTLCGDLMARDPAARPEDGEILRRTGVSEHTTSGAEAHEPGRPPSLIGREAGSPSSETPSAPWVSVRQSPSTCMASPGSARVRWSVISPTPSSEQPRPWCCGVAVMSASRCRTRQWTASSTA